MDNDKNGQSTSRTPTIREELEGLVRALFSTTTDEPRSEPRIQQGKAPAMIPPPPPMLDTEKVVPKTDEKVVPKTDGRPDAAEHAKVAASAVINCTAPVSRGCMVEPQNRAPAGGRGQVRICPMTRILAPRVCVFAGVAAALLGVLAASESSSPTMAGAATHFVAGLTPDHETMKRGADWLVAIQNPDGGWGENCDSYKLDYKGYEPAPSTASQTAWALLGLMAAGQVDHPAVAKGVAWLFAQQQPDGLWEQAHYTGGGFPRVFYLRYHGYPKFFPLWALARYRNLRRTNARRITHGM